MTSVFSPQASVPSENWDEDFEFDPSLGPTASTSTNLPRASEDWDRELPHEQNTTSTPSTPPRKPYIETTENWDDDFEDADSPARKTPSKGTRAYKSKSSLRSRHGGAGIENWDDEFDLPPATRSTVPSSAQTQHPDDDFDDETEFGMSDREEEKTVTARSRRAQMATAPQESPPPPVPPIPFSLLTSNSHEQPHLRSPNPSVFSLPNTVAPSYSSTTHLRTTLSRTSINTAGLAGLPPSPPIHKERERRRLRKKSRPHPEALPTLSDRTPTPDSDYSYESGHSGPTSVFSPQPPPDTSPATPKARPAAPTTATTPSNKHRNSLSIMNIPSSPPFLSRIGSVKKWTGRKKRAGSTPADSIVQEHRDRYPVTDLTPRPPSSHSIGPSSPTTRSRMDWFSRSSSGTSSVSSPGQNPSATDLTGRGIREEEVSAKLIKKKSLGFIPLRRNRGLPVNEDSDVAIIHQHSDLPPDLESELEKSNAMKKKKRHLSQQYSKPSTSGSSQGQSRHASYSSLRYENPGPFTEERIKPRKRSTSRSRSRGATVPDDGNRSFMGSMRRLSLVGNHKRTKSTTSSMVTDELPHIEPKGKEREQELRDAAYEDLVGYKTPSRKESPLPPIELQPPSPPQDRPILSQSFSADAPSPNRRPLSPNISPQSASVGRSGVITVAQSSSPSSSTNVPRRNSLGDLKIPTRISQAQISLRRDLGLVREFAASVEKLKELQNSYQSTVSHIQVLLDAHTPSRASSPTVFNLPRRPRSNTEYRRLASTFYTINSKYRIAWECAELLVDLGSGSTAAAATADTTPTPPTTSNSAPAISQHRARAITLSGEDSNASSPVQTTGPSPPIASPPPNLGWRASTGRHDLSQRQLLLLKEMLNPPTPPAEEEIIEEEANLSVNRGWKWGDSTVTLPSSEAEEEEEIPQLKPRKKKMGLRSLRDMLRNMKKASTTATQQQQHQPRRHSPVSVPMSTTSLSTTESGDGTKKKRKTKNESESVRSQRERATSPYLASLSSTKASPRRPSLASIFRIGIKPKSGGGGTGSSSHTSVNEVSSSPPCSSGEEDWDHVPVAAPDFSGTIRGRPGYTPVDHDPTTPRVGDNGSQSSLWIDASASAISPQTARRMRLSNVEEDESAATGSSGARQQPRFTRGGKTGSVRSMPQAATASEVRLAMTPENIKPLLENAKEVHVRLVECLSELNSLQAELVSAS